MVTSFASVLTGFGKMSDLDGYNGLVIPWPYEGGISASEVARRYNIKISGCSKGKIKENLMQGKPVVIDVFGPKKGGQSKFTKEMHKMALIDISSDGSKVYVSNPGSSQSSKNGWIDFDYVTTSLNEAWVFYE